jgi:hypothetical protein
VAGYLTNLSIGNYGRFANGMYQIAAVFGIARKNNLTPVFPLWRNQWHRDAFGSTEDIDLYKHFVNPLPVLPDNIRWQDKQIEWGYHDIRLPAGNWNISGHFQSTKYFAHCLDEVRFYFRMVGEPEPNDYCACHVRLGDYDNTYHPRLDMRYYERAMAHFPASQKFLVFSDDLDAARKMFGSSVEYSEGRDYIQDWKLLKTCRHFIIGNSSYSAMAAVLGGAGDKKVIAPRPWFGPAYTNITGEDIYNSDWIVIDYQRL